MSQRVYLIPVKQDLVQLFTDMLTTDSDSREQECWDAIRARAERHQRISRLSRWYANGMQESVFTTDDREGDYYAMTAMQPYLVTASDPREATRVIQELLACTTDEAISQRIAAQLESPYWEPPADDKKASIAQEDEETWAHLRQQVKMLKHYRKCFNDNVTIDVEYLRRVSEEGADVTIWNMDETEIEVIQPAKIPEVYGHALGSTFGRIAGMSEPTWWLGNNIWVGLLRAGDWLVRPGFFDTLKVRKLRKQLQNLCESPAPLFAKAGLPGYERGFDISCPAYSSGAYISPAHVASMVALLEDTSRVRVWFLLAAMVTGYHPNYLIWSIRMIGEALLWAQAEGCGLMEGDELVGSSGIR